MWQYRHTFEAKPTQKKIKEIPERFQLIILFAIAKLANVPRFGHTLVSETFPQMRSRSGVDPDKEAEGHNLKLGQNFFNPASVSKTPLEWKQHTDLYETATL